MKIFTKPHFVLMVMFLSACFALPSALADAESPDKVLIKNDGYRPDRKGPVHFSHAAHADSYAIRCEVCHHEYEDGVNVWEEGEDVPACNECHETDDEDNGMLRLKMAYHKNCQGCHKVEPSRVSGAAPFNRCNACHLKEKAK
jgi:hypothetical protein